MRSSEIEITRDHLSLPGRLDIPQECIGIVLFAHGSGSTRFSPRNLRVAKTLNEKKIATLLFDLLTPSEADDRSNIFDIPLLASRLVLATHWIEQQNSLRNLPIGYFGASTGGGAALWAAAELGSAVSAVVSRGGRPDLAIPRLEEVISPTLLIVGGEDEIVIQMNREAMRFMKNVEIQIIPGATHLFEEPGALDSVAHLATIWFLDAFKKSTSRKVQAA